MEGTTLYELLGAPETATRDELKKLYWAKAQEVHPDKLPQGVPQKVKDLAEEEFKLLNLAWNTLSDSEKRAKYDACLERMREDELRAKRGEEERERRRQEEEQRRENKRRAEEQSRREAAERVRREAEEQARQATEQAKREAEERARREAEERARRAAAVQPPQPQSSPQRPPQSSRKPASSSRSRTTRPPPNQPPPIRVVVDRFSPSPSLFERAASWVGFLILPIALVTLFIWSSGKEKAEKIRYENQSPEGKQCFNLCEPGWKHTKVFADFGIQPPDEWMNVCRDTCEKNAYLYMKYLNCLLAANSSKGLQSCDNHIRNLGKSSR